MFEFVKSLFGLKKDKKKVYTGEDFRIKNIQELCKNQEGIIQPFILQIIDKNSCKLSVYVPCSQIKIAYARFNWRTDNYIELIPNSRKNADYFVSLFDENLKFLKNQGVLVYKYSLAEYKDMRLFVSENGTSGFAIKPDGEINSIFSSKKGSLHAMIELAIQNGGNKLYCFDTFLTKVFIRHGFKEIKRSKWDESTMPDVLYKEYYRQLTNTEPDMVYYELSLDKVPEEEKL